MTAYALCLNAGATDRLTLGVYYRVVSVLRGYVIVVDDKGDKTMFWRERFEAVKEEEKVTTPTGVHT